MLFNSQEFLIFLPIVFLLYWFVFKPLRWQNLLVVVVSYVFYGWWDWRFLSLIIFTSVCSYASGLMIERYRDNRRASRIVAAANIIINLCILGVFKYYNFFVHNLEHLLNNLGMALDWPTIYVILPVGISFYTFQALSYTIDVYRRQIEPTRDVVAFFAFISFFPQLVAGPIERATNLLPQFLTPRRFDEESAVDGCRQMLWGFFKKIAIADTISPVVEGVWNTYPEQNGMTLLSIGVLFSFQIYCDFSGYSDIAIGCARLFGIRLMRNFNYPYFSRSIPEFWRRWHISLTTWFRDYVYFPLGGSRCAKWKVIRNVYIVWGVSGLWHGANWTFVCWGLFHATLLAIYNILGVNTKFAHTAGYGKFLPGLGELAMMVLTFFLAVIGWIIFRAENIHQAADYLSVMFTRLPADFLHFSGKPYLLLCLLVLLIEWFQREKQHALQFTGGGISRFPAFRWIVYVVISFVCVYLGGGEKSDFIYFQF